MKKSAIFFLALLLNSIGISQTEKFGELGFEWHNHFNVSYNTGPGQGWDYTYLSEMYKYTDDIIVGSDTFQVFTMCSKQWQTTGISAPSYMNDSIYAYQDSLRVFFGTSPGNTNLIYDFNLEVGDSAMAYTLNTSIDSLYLNVDSTDSVLVQGTWRKRIIFEDINQNNPGMRWVEGVGDEYYGLFRSNIFLPIFTTYSFCMKEFGTVHFGTCTSIHVCPPEWMSTESLSEVSPNLEVYPNPFNDMLTFNLPALKSTVFVFDITGKKVYDFQGQGNNQVVDLSFLNPGTYVVKLLNDEQIFTTKIIKK